MIAALVLSVLSQAAPPKLNTILQELMKNGHFRDTITLLHTTGLDHQVGANGHDYTLFAVPDSAYAKLPAEARKAILNQDRFGSSIAGNHLLTGKYGYDSFINGTSALGQPLTHTVKTWAETTFTTISRPNGLFIGKVKVLRDIPCSNGTIMVVDGFIPYEIPAPKGLGLERVIPAEILKWGLGRYRPVKPLPATGIIKAGAID